MEQTTWQARQWWRGTAGDVRVAAAKAAAVRAGSDGAQDFAARRIEAGYRLGYAGGGVAPPVERRAGARVACRPARLRPRRAGVAEELRPRLARLFGGARDAPASGMSG